jgi:hypothetical protein
MDFASGKEVDHIMRDGLKQWQDECLVEHMIEYMSECLTIEM